MEVLKVTQSKFGQKKDGTIEVKALKNAHIFKYSELDQEAQEKLPRALNRFIGQTTTDYCAKISCNVYNDNELSNVFERVVNKILLSLDTNKTVGID